MRMQLRKTRRFLRPGLIGIALLIGLSNYASAETFIFKSGRFFEGKILRETSKTYLIETPYGNRTVKKEDIEEILEDFDFSDADSLARFEKLPDVVRALMNARADYLLKNYDRAMERIEPYKDYDKRKGVRIELDWLRIELYCRLARWEDAREMLDKKKESGSPREITRAEAYLDIFDRNPDYDLRYIGTTHARQFLRLVNRHLRDRAREPNSLSDVEIFHAALQEFCEQRLLQADSSVRALEAALNRQEILQAIADMPPTVDVERYLPYAKELKMAEDSLYEVDAVLPGYGVSYDRAIIRTECEFFVQEVYLGALHGWVMQRNPNSVNWAFDPVTGRLNRESRQLLQEVCDEFVERQRKVIQITEYLLHKTEDHPRAFATYNELFKAVIEHHENLILWAKRVRSKSRV